MANVFPIQIEIYNKTKDTTQKGTILQFIAVPADNIEGADSESGLFAICMIQGGVIQVYNLFDQNLTLWEPDEDENG